MENGRMTDGLQMPEPYMYRGLLRAPIIMGGNAIIALVKSEDEVVGYEVWRVEVAEASEMFGRELPRRIVTPSAEKFGKYALTAGSPKEAAWYYCNLEKGLNHYGSEWGSQTYVGYANKRKNYGPVSAEMGEIINQINRHL